MRGFLLDTNVLSEFNRRGEPNQRVKQWLAGTPLESLYVSVITLAEIRLGIELLAPGKRREQLEDWINRDFQKWFEGRVLPVDGSIATLWASLTAHRQLKGRRLSNFDGLLAATALRHNLTLATRNVRDFVDLQITLFNPWEAEAEPAPSPDQDMKTKS
ncbi:MAG TPA: type II toxin-antitoxin system VapC family toxin [Terriglobia bacterium]|nr:type II toxin-antitoxin system VapC family toxin [Terriglobia bacterium]